MLRGVGLRFHRERTVMTSGLEQAVQGMRVSRVSRKPDHRRRSGTAIAPWQPMYSFRGPTMDEIDTLSEKGACEFAAQDSDLCERVRGEYREMPGLRLTLAQASRLFNLEASQCARVLQALVSGGALRTDGRQFLASNLGRHRN
jgi:hypothetical protein